MATLLLLFLTASRHEARCESTCVQASSACRSNCSTSSCGLRCDARQGQCINACLPLAVEKGKPPAPVRKKAVARRKAKVIVVADSG